MLKILLTFSASIWGKDDPGTHVRTSGESGLSGAVLCKLQPICMQCQGLQGSSLLYRLGLQRQ